MFGKVLVANRGVIACRILRTLDRMGITSVAIYSEGDRHARHVAQASEAARIGDGPVAESHLAAERVRAAARASGAEAIHAGYGFLSENPEFAEACAAAGIVLATVVTGRRAGRSPGLARPRARRSACAAGSLR